MTHSSSSLTKCRPQTVRSVLRWQRIRHLLACQRNMQKRAETHSYACSLYGWVALVLMDSGLWKRSWLVLFHRHLRLTLLPPQSSIPWRYVVLTAATFPQGIQWVSGPWKRLSQQQWLRERDAVRVDPCWVCPYSQATEAVFKDLQGLFHLCQYHTSSAQCCLPSFGDGAGGAMGQPHSLGGWTRTIWSYHDTDSVTMYAHAPTPTLNLSSLHLSIFLFLKFGLCY